MILNETVAAIADAIREKTGKSELIKPVDFASEIKGITAGGGESGGSSYIYYDQKKTIMNIKSFWECSSTIKVSLEGQAIILRTSKYANEIKEGGLEGTIIAVCVDPNVKFQDDPTDPLSTLIEKNPEIFEWINEARITKEEFYDLNA